MITGDLVKCNRTGSLGIITKIADANPHTGNTEWIYHILWTEPKSPGASPHDRRRADDFGALAWASAENFTPIPDEEYAV